MPNFSNYAESGLLNWLFRSNTNNFARPSQVAVALCATIPLENQNGTNIPELPNANGYARVNLGPPLNGIFTEVTQTFSDTTTGAGSGNIDNVAAITFPVATGNWGYVSGIAVCDSGAYGIGQMLMYGALTVPRVVLSGDTFQFAIGDLDIYLG